MPFGFDGTIFALGNMLICMADITRMHLIYVATTGEQKYCSILPKMLISLCFDPPFPLGDTEALQSYDKLSPECLSGNGGLTKA